MASEEENIEKNQEQYLNDKFVLILVFFFCWWLIMFDLSVGKYNTCISIFKKGPFWVE